MTIEVPHFRDIDCSGPGQSAPAAETVAPTEKKSFQARQGELILIVDDEPAFREYQRVALELYGYEVIEAGDGAEGIRMFREHPEIKLVITDITMPVMDGAAMIYALRELKADVRILAVSGSLKCVTIKTIPEDIGFLEKPIKFDTLLAEVYAALNGAK